MEFQPCTGRKVGWGRELGSIAPEKSKCLLTEAARKPLSSSAAITDPSAINTTSTAGVLGEQHASRLCTKRELVEPYCSTHLKSWTKTIPKLPLSTDYLKMSYRRRCMSGLCMQLAKHLELSWILSSHVFWFKADKTISPFTPCFYMTTSPRANGLLQGPFWPSDTWQHYIKRTSCSTGILGSQFCQPQYL